MSGKYLKNAATTQEHEFNDIKISEELESFEIITFNKEDSLFNNTQVFESENNDSNKNVQDFIKDYSAQEYPEISETQYSHEESEEDYIEEDIWDDFNLSKPHKKVMKSQRRHKAMVRYKNTTPVIDFDEATKFLLKRLVVSRYMSRYYHIIGTGSQSILLYGNSSTIFSLRLPWEVAVKVYKNNEASYKRAQNELKSLDRLKRCKINGPSPVCAWRNIIVMGAIGYGRTAQSITTAPSESDLKNYLHITDSVRRMYQIAKVVHGNLSHRSILWYGEPYFISLAHSVPTDHPDALKLLIKDCYNVTHLFKDKGLAEHKTTEELFKFVTDLPEIDDTLVTMLQNLKPIDTTEDMSYNSIYSTSKRPFDYSLIMKFCSHIHR